MSETIPEEKSQLRQYCRAIRKSLGAEKRAQASLSICERIETWDIFQQSNVILTYMPIKSEVDLTPLLERYPRAACKALQAVDWQLDWWKQIVFAPGAGGAGRAEFERVRAGVFLPNQVVAAVDQRPGAGPAIASGKTTILEAATWYVCDERGCSSPLTDLTAVMERLKECRPLSLDRRTAEEF